MTDTIGWGDVDDPPRRLPRLRLTRRRRIALLVAVALVAGGVVAWPSFRSWRADAAARAVEHIWAREQGFDNARVITLDGVQSTLGILDASSFSRAVRLVDREEATDLDRLIRQAKSLRTWTSDVADARRAVVSAMVAQSAALRRQADGLVAVGVDLPVTTSLDDDAASTAEVAGTKVEAMRSRHHLLLAGPTTEKYHSADAILAALRRPTDDLLHLRLVATGSDGISVTDLDTGKVLLRRFLDTTDVDGWEPVRLLGQAVVGSINTGTFIVPFSQSGRERVIPDAYAESSTGSPMWLSSLGGMQIGAYDGSGRLVSRLVPVPNDLALTGFGSPSVLLATNGNDGSINGPQVTQYDLFRPATGARVRLPVFGCPQNTPSFDGGVVAIATADLCDFPTELQLFGTSGRLIRTAVVPHGEVINSAPLVSPDGTQVAVLTSAHPLSDVPPTTLRLLDVRTGTWTAVANSNGWLPLSWSSDGTTLLLQFTANQVFTSNQQFSQLAYLRLGDAPLHSIRLNADLANFLVTP